MRHHEHDPNVRARITSPCTWKAQALVRWLPWHPASVFAAILAGVLFANSHAGAQAIFWNRKASDGPTPRTGHAMAYDVMRGETILFGGYDELGMYRNDTWGWNGAAWTSRAVTGPSPRYSHAMAYDAGRRGVVLFGGTVAASDPYTDTWTWNGVGVGWTRRTVVGPPGRRNHAMAYDVARGTIVLFGGYSNGGILSGETWEWNGLAWTQRMVSGPSPRSSHAMAYDSVRGMTVLFGGHHGNNVYDSETWEWDGTAWTQRAVPGPSPRAGHAMAFDAGRGVTVLFGGDTDSAADGETWEWNGSVWSQRFIAGPSPRFGPEMVYDSARSTIVLFGGSSRSGQRSGETWELGPCTAPTITTQPATQTVCLKSWTTFTVAAAGTTAFSYQWRRGSPPVPISGATDATYVLVRTLGTDAGRFDCVVSNACGSVISNPARLTVCVADVDDGSGTGVCDGGVTADDLLYFLSAYADGVYNADVDNGSRTGVPDDGVTIDDLLYFLARFVAGC